MLCVFGTLADMVVCCPQRMQTPGLRKSATRCPTSSARVRSRLGMMTQGQGAGAAADDTPDATVMRLNFTNVEVTASTFAANATATSTVDAGAPPTDLIHTTAAVELGMGEEAITMTTSDAGVDARAPPPIATQTAAASVHWTHQQAAPASAITPPGSAFTPVGDDVRASITSLPSLVDVMSPTIRGGALRPMSRSGLPRSSLESASRLHDLTRSVDEDEDEDELCSLHGAAAATALAASAGSNRDTETVADPVAARLGSRIVALGHAPKVHKGDVRTAVAVEARRSLEEGALHDVIRAAAAGLHA